MHKLITRLLAAVAKTSGYTVIPNWRLEHAAQCDFMNNLFHLLETDCIFDVGANQGQYGKLLRQQVGFNGLIVSFEPIPANCEQLKELARIDGNWVVYELALGRETGRTQFNVMADSQFSSFLNPDITNAAMFRDQNRVVQKIDVEVRTLAEMIPKVIQEHYCSSLYLKLDTQGFDLLVAQGAGDEISRFRALQTEASITSIYENSPTFFDTLTYFREAGFELSGIFPNNPEHFPRMLEFDCHMINRNQIPHELT